MEQYYTLLIFFLIPCLYSDSENIFLIDNFNTSEIGTLPEGWNGRKEEASKYYQIREDIEDENNKYLSVKNDKTDMFIIKKIKVDLVKYPYLNWKWRVNQLPVNGKESKRKTCDVPASMNVVLIASKWRPKTIKYTWSSTLEKGSRTKSPYAIWPSRCDILVLQSGEVLKGEWVSEKRNVLEDYTELYKKKKVKSKIVEAIVIMSDGDNTSSISAADYDDIFFSAE
jgi:hypothetical protein